MAGSFHEILFPENISYGSSGGPQWKTSVFTADSGFEQRNVDWSSTRAAYQVEQSIKTQDQMDVLTEFFFNRKGKAYGFRFKDWNDFSASQQIIGTGDGSTHSFQLIKTYTSAQTESGESYTYTRNITKPNWNTVAGVTVDGTVVTAPLNYTVDYTTGIITFSAAPASGAVIKIGYYEFHVPVRFDIDQLNTTHEFWNTQSWPSIPLVEVRDWDGLNL